MVILFIKNGQKTRKKEGEIEREKDRELPDMNMPFNSVQHAAVATVTQGWILASKGHMGVMSCM